MQLLISRRHQEMQLLISRRRQKEDKIEVEKEEFLNELLAVVDGLNEEMIANTDLVHYYEEMMSQFN